VDQHRGRSVICAILWGTAVFLDSQTRASDYELRQKNEQGAGEMPFPRNSIQDSYNSAVVAGDYTLAERYAACWLWLLMAEKEHQAGRISRRTLVTLPPHQSPTISDISIDHGEPSESDHRNGVAGA
jgi:hypothetical protein